MTSARRQHGTPLLVTSSDAGQRVDRLIRIELTASPESAFSYDEKWIQRLVFDAPSVLPVQQIEPGFGELISVCTELPTPAGYADNLLVTPDGQLILVECKLWRNPESRRKVLTQVMDYASRCSRWEYEELEEAVLRAQRPGPASSIASLWDLVSSVSDLEERDFVDAVSRNLRLGRILLLIVGDGIDEGVERLAATVQSHVGLHYAIALVELALFRHPVESSVIVQPRVIARTVNIERGIVRLEGDELRIEAPAQTDGIPSKGHGTTLSEEEFLDRIALVGENLPKRIQAFIPRVQKLGVEIETKKTLILRWRAADHSKFNLGYIDLTGALWTDAVNSVARNPDYLDLTRAYLKEISDAVGGDLTQSDKRDDSYLYVARNGKCVDIGTMLDHADDWFAAIERLINSVNQRIAETQSERID